MPLRHAYNGETGLDRTGRGGADVASETNNAIVRAAIKPVIGVARVGNSPLRSAGPLGPSVRRRHQQYDRLGVFKFAQSIPSLRLDDFLVGHAK